MPSVKIAFRQLFIARGCDVNENNAFIHKLDVLGYAVTIYLGRDPKLPIDIRTKQSAVFDPILAAKKMLPLTFGMKPALETEHAGSVFFEVFCEGALDVSEEDYGILNAESSDGNIRKKLIEEFRINQESKISTVANAVSGFMGLRMHHQFTYETLNENYWIWSEREKSWAIDSVSSQAVRMLEGLTLSELGMEIVRNFSFNPILKFNYLAKVALCLFLLRRGWQDEEATYKFLNFFTALELAVISATEGADPIERARIEKLKALVMAHYPQADQLELLKFVDGFQIRAKSLTARFEEVVKEADFESSEDDLEAFKEFCKARNKLFHGGGGTPLTVTCSSGRSIKLEGLAEQYLNWIFFRDDQPYQSRFSPRSKMRNKKRES